MGSTAEDDGLVVLDSLDEANGQAVRIAITLSAVTLKPVRFEKIRQSADQPGEAFPSHYFPLSQYPNIPMSKCPNATSTVKKYLAYLGNRFQ